MMMMMLVVVAGYDDMIMPVQQRIRLKQLTITCTNGLFDSANKYNHGHYLTVNSSNIIKRIFPHKESYKLMT